MRRECRKRLPRHRLQRKALFSDPGIHHGMCVTHVPWCMSGSLNRGGKENVLGIPGTCTTYNFTYLVSGPWRWGNMSEVTPKYMANIDWGIKLWMGVYCWHQLSSVLSCPTARLYTGELMLTTPTHPSLISIISWFQQLWSVTVIITLMVSKLKLDSRAITVCVAKLARKFESFAIAPTPTTLSWNV